jgi:hypothetical protein
MGRARVYDGRFSPILDLHRQLISFASWVSLSKTPFISLYSA